MNDAEPQRAGRGVELAADFLARGCCRTVALVTSMPRGGRGDQGRDLRDEAVADRQDGVGADRLGERHALRQPDDEAADEVDRGDDDGGDRVAADEPAGTVHRAVELALAHQRLRGGGCASASSISPAFISASIAICLPGIESRVNRAATSDDAAGTLRDDHELDDDRGSGRSPARRPGCRRRRTSRTRATISPACALGGSAASSRRSAPAGRASGARAATGTSRNPAAAARSA